MDYRLEKQMYMTSLEHIRKTKKILEENEAICTVEVEAFRYKKRMVIRRDIVLKMLELVETIHEKRIVELIEEQEKEKEHE